MKPSPAQEKNAEQYSQKLHPWGTEINLVAASSYRVNQMTIWSRKRLSLQYHRLHSLHCVLVSGGPVQLEIQGDRQLLQANQSFYVPTGVRYRISNLSESPMTLITVQYGTIKEDDIIRLEDDFGREVSRM